MGRLGVRALLLAWVALASAGCAAVDHSKHGRSVHSAGGLDSGDIAPGGEANLTFASAGDFVIHCHPHPFMRQAVRVTDAEASDVHVHVFDGASQDEYRFEPGSLVVGAGSQVTYHNHGSLTHTATQDDARLT